MRDRWLEKATLMLWAGLIMFHIFLFIDPWFGFWCAVASVVYAMGMYTGSMILDTRGRRS